MKIVSSLGRPACRQRHAEGPRRFAEQQLKRQPACPGIAAWGFEGTNARIIAAPDAALKIEATADILGGIFWQNPRTRMQSQALSRSAEQSNLNINKVGRFRILKAQATQCRARV